ncbi:MAG: hypothetical protein ACFHU9_08300 [Fluviicola sp.]
MKIIIQTAFAILCMGYCLGQEEKKNEIFQNLFTTEDKVYQFVQLSSGYSGRHPLVGVQYKRINSQLVYYFTMFTGYSVAAHWTRLNGENAFQSSYELHAKSYPYSLTLRLGLGVDLQTNFSDQTYLSVFPSVGYDFGFAEISYAYLINRQESYILPKHRIRLSIGLCVKKSEQ